MGLPKILVKILPESWVYNYTLNKQIKSISPDMSEVEWIAKGKLSPPPPAVKRKVIKVYAEKHKINYFVETGTFMGDTSFEMKDVFEKVYTIELDEKLFLRAKNRFEKYPTISVIQGDSGVVLDQILQKISPPKTCLFWLDGHYSGGVTAGHDSIPPILNEIDIIYKYGHNHIILIDDARLFDETHNGYPSIESLTAHIKTHDKNALIEVKDDLIMITSE